MPTREEIAVFERPDFAFDKWADGHLAGPGYVERLTRIYMDQLRLEPNVNFSTAPSQLGRKQITGDVWVLASGKLSRFARLDPEPELARAWKDKLSGVFARSCASCHQSNGPSGIDLSSAEAWHSRRTLIHDRVVVSRSMPPQGHALADPDRDAIKVWSETTTAPP
jgi:mono/diheme cytochrome c family protein